MPTRTKDLDALARAVSNEHFWHELKGPILERVLPLFGAIYLGGVDAAARMVNKPGAVKAAGPIDQPDFSDLPAKIRSVIMSDHFAAEGAMYVAAYSDAWYAGIEKSTRNELIRIIADARATGASTNMVADAIAPLFGRDRAQRIAVTETTRLFGAAAQQTYRGLDVHLWLWRTANDSDVDEVCDAMEQGGPYPMDIPFQPAHVNCRCFPAPITPSG